MSLADELAFEFTTRNITWAFPDGDRVPTSEDIQFVLDKARDRLHTKDEDWNQLMLGGLIVVKIGDHYDVFFRIGEIDGVSDANEAGG